ncbi:MAG TPA: cache domain-containing protein, partial [Actinomycetota bacterium]|nr:cache domain-containing protein [Actinomycetota bacterium]
MSLQSRLFAFFIVIVVMPLTIAPLIGQRILVRELERRTFEQIKAAESAEMKVFDEKRSRANERVAVVARDPALVAAIRARRSAEADQVLAGHRQEVNDPLSFIVVTDTSGRVVASSLTEPSFVPAVTLPIVDDLARSSAPDQRLLFYRDEAYVTESGPVPDSPVTLGRVYGGFYYDERFLSSLSTQSSVGTTLFVAGRAVASTLRTVKTSKAAVTITPLLYSSEGKRLSLKISGVPSYAIARPLNHGVRISEASFVFSRPQSSVIAVKRTLQRSLFGLLGAAILIAGTLGWALARVISRPLRELAAGANQIAIGNYDQTIRV